MHQHASFQDLLDNLNLDPSHLERYFEYKNQVDCELYHDVNMFNLEQEAIEENWPLQKDSANLLLQAKCCDLPPEQWQRLYAKASQQVQKLVNHHVHPKDFVTGERKFLKGCVSKRRPNECRGRYPRTLDVQHFRKQNAILCPKLANVLGLKTSGRKNCLGSCIGKRNHESLNGGHRALLLNLRCNSDTLLSWRMPICEETHQRCDSIDCLVAEALQESAQSVRRAQRDQAGYISDYAAKKTPVAKREVWQYDRSFTTLQHQLLKGKHTKKRYYVIQLFIHCLNTCLLFIVALTIVSTSVHAFTHCVCAVWRAVTRAAL
jgi:hypothetical protein